MPVAASSSGAFEPVSIEGSASRRRLLTKESLVLATLLSLLVIAVVLQAIPHPTATVIARDVSLHAYFPGDMSGWHGEDRPLAETEATKGAVEKILRYDEAFLRRYRKAGQEFSVYVAFWKAGKMSSREIAAHTPDVCWPANGWQRTASDTHFQRKLFGATLAEAQYREFDLSGHREHLVYWHIVNGYSVTYNADGLPGPFSMLADLKKYGLHQKGEQYFIRISSPTDLDTLWHDDGFQEILELIAPLGPGLQINRGSDPSQAEK